MAPTLSKGTIKTLVPARKESGRDRGGYGFIEDEQGHERFFHARDLVDVDGQEAPFGTFQQLKEHQTVEFRPFDGRKAGNGLAAEKVRVVA